MLICLGATPTVQRTMVFDKLTPDAVNRAASVDEYASGKAINVARVARALGTEVIVTGFVGGDRGAYLRRELDQDGIGHDFAAVAPVTRLCTTLIDRASGSVTELVEESAAVAAGDWEALEARFAALMRGATACVLSGSLPPGAPADFYAGRVRQAKAAGALVVIDARGDSLRRAMIEGGCVVKVNREELAATLGAPLASEAELREGLRQTAPPAVGVLVTMGAAGAVAFAGGDFLRIESPQVQVVNPIGSGDSVAAGVAVALARGEPFEEACRLGIACGAANAMTPRAGSVSLPVVNELRAKIQISRW